MPTSQISSIPHMWEHTRAQHDSRLEGNPDIPMSVADQAFEEMYRAINDIDNLIKGYSYYFLEHKLAFLKGNAINVPPDHLLHIMQVVTGIISMGPWGVVDHENGDIFASLNNDSWCRVVMALLVVILRGCMHTRNFPDWCNFKLGNEDTFEVPDQLR